MLRKLGAGIFAAGILFGVGCASKILQYENSKAIETNEEYSKKVKIKELAPPPVITEGNTAMLTVGAISVTGPTMKAKEPTKKKKEVAPKEKVAMAKHLPEYEDSEGFLGRRPVVDPFRIGEKVTLGLTYFNLTAGYLDLEVLPFVEVNGERAYNFRATARTNSVFSRFYAVDDKATTYVSYERMIPLTFEISVRESKQLADIRSFFDWKKMKGIYWEKRKRKDQEETSKNIEWDIKPFSQNVISAVYYLRSFTLTPGKKLSFPVADEGKNIIFKGEVLRREELDTDVGKFKTIVVKPQFEVDGVFSPTGDILLWLTDDDRKFLVRLESKIKIGTIVGKLKAIEPGG